MLDSTLKAPAKTQLKTPSDEVVCCIFFIIVDICKCRGKQCGPRSDCSTQEQSDLGQHCLTKRLQTTFVVIGALRVKCLLVSDWFRTVQALEVLGMAFGGIALLMILLHSFVATCAENRMLKIFSFFLCIVSCKYLNSSFAQARGYKTYFMLNSIEHELLTAHKNEFIDKKRKFFALRLSDVLFIMLMYV